MKFEWNDRTRPILIAGPTASGKSALAVELAERLDGTVINADSMQVYAELRVLTARPSPEDEARVPHVLYGHVPVRDPYSSGRWLGDVADALRGVNEAGRRPILVGGTGLYFRALTQGMAEIPAVGEEVRRAVRDRLEIEGAPALHAELSVRDPVSAARIPLSDPQRILRALEVLEATGRPLSSWQADPPLPPLVRPDEAIRLVLWPDRAWLLDRISRRTKAMLEGGAIEEAKTVEAMDLDPELPSYRAHGLRALLAYVAGEAGYDDTVEKIRMDTRRYAKRQFTWFRTQMPDWPRSLPEAALADLRGTLGV
ncbi:tRNA (adenosine(37)-N6)-dimethylallyltransferase MiaA [Lutibaculum baratangense]|uniref:tRNA dimethylallyltransferase n=1 Tax=Lutibaculum baratangense AMV1 TaxID=631454 RepID=V4RW98_9HYPH|nr:tRNA (adenosine(37)-N6)-dimethylallyltransferase MiaA [Lutibaculum baratangense]ESR27295.1 tRNA delta(2)-isopentenylpyrophosphate transferase [Lutibaculum baratangense AMV1]